MYDMLLFFTDSEKRLLKPEIIQLHPGVREALAYLDFSFTDIPNGFGLGMINEIQKKYRSLTRVIIECPDPSMYPKYVTHDGKYLSPSKDKFVETLGNRCYTEKVPESSFWIQTYKKQCRRALPPVIDRPGIQFHPRVAYEYR